MADETITFDLIRKIQTEEKMDSRLSKLPDNFYENVNAYLEQKRKIEAKDDRKTGLEIKNIERLAEDIFNRRERKILNLVLISARTGIPPENLTQDEEDVFKNIMSTIKQRREDVLNKLFKKEKKQESGNKVVFKDDVSEFVGSDMKTYGPFKKGDTAELPEENMKLLLDKGVVEKV